MREEVKKVWDNISTVIIQLFVVPLVLMLVSDSMFGFTRSYWTWLGAWWIFNMVVMRFKKSG